MKKTLPILDPRIPKWDRSHLVRRNCPTCQGEEKRQTLVRPDGLEVNECHVCSTWYVSPAPDAEALKRFYEQYHQAYFSPQATSPKKAYETIRHVTHRSWGIKHLLKDLRLARICQYISLEGKNVLDVGCGRGKMLRLMQGQGAKVYGVDPDPGAVEYVRTCGFDQVWQGGVEAVDKTLAFDVITISDVIEHPLDPLHLLSECTGRLNQDGIIMIWTPNADRVRLDPEHVMFRIHLEHMQYFSANSLERLCKKAGLKVLHTEVHGHPYLDTIHKLNSKSKPLEPLHRKVATLFDQLAIKMPFAFRAGLMSGLRGSYSLLAIVQRAQ